MATPHYAVRLPKEDQQLLINMARVYGAPNTSAFLREMIQCMCSEDVEDAHGFVDRVTEKMTGQLSLSFPVVAVEKPTKRTKKKKGGKRRDRAA